MNEETVKFINREPAPGKWTTPVMRPCPLKKGNIQVAPMNVQCALNSRSNMNTKSGVVTPEKGFKKMKLNTLVTSVRIH